MKKHGTNSLHVVDVVQGVGVKEKEIGELAWLDGALRLEFAEEFGRISCGGLQRLHGSEARLYEVGEVFVQAGTGEDVWSG